MKYFDIKEGHLAQNVKFPQHIAYKGLTHGMWVSGPNAGLQLPNNLFTDDYNDLGPLYINIEFVTKTVVTLSLG